MTPEGDGRYSVACSQWGKKIQCCGHGLLAAAHALFESCDHLQLDFGSGIFAERSSGADGKSQNWLYLPALKRVKRISSRNKSGSFVGSEFAYEDISSQEVEKYTYKWIRDETLDGMECFVFERYPAYKNSGYTRQVVWLDKKEYRMLKIDFYDRKNSLLKTQTFRGYHQYLGKFWYPDEMFMQNHQTGKSTLLKWSDYKFKVGFKDRDFNRNSLKRAR